MSDEKFTWGDLKKMVNRIPKRLLQSKVTVWQDESGFVITGFEILKEDYIYDGDMGCAPKSTMKDVLKEEKRDFPDWASDYHLVHPKGTRILNAE